MPSHRHALVLPARLGYAARGVVFLIGVCVMRAALPSDPREAGGLGGALCALQGQPFGQFLYGVVALGLFEFAEARYRRIEAPG